MPLLHHHQWQEVSRYFVPPLAELKTRDMAPDLFREATQGVTVIELRCEGCGDVAERRLAGDAT